MKVTKIVVGSTIILEMNEKEYAVLKTLLNNTGFERDDRIRAYPDMWCSKMDEEEALKLGYGVEDAIWHPIIVREER